MLDGVTINQLRTFVAVCDEGSFSGAARHLRRAQSAVSHAVAALEDALRVELFERLGPLSFAHLNERGAAGAVVAQLPSDRHVTLDEAICFSVAPEDAQLFDADGVAYPRVGTA